MINQYPLWKYLLLLIVLIVGVVYALPNLYGDDPALQISATGAGHIDDSTRQKVASLLEQDKIPYRSITIGENGLLVRFMSVEDQLKAKDELVGKLGRGYVMALNLASAAPHWFASINALPMYLGLDLRGGLHFLMQVDMQAAMYKELDRYESEFRTVLREDHIRYQSILREKNAVILKFPSNEERDKGRARIHGEYRDLLIADDDQPGGYFLRVTLSQAKLLETERNALQQNITTLRNRVNELGVAEPVIQQEGDDRIVVQLPGIQDSAHAKEILGATATLEFRLVDVEHSVADAVAGRVPATSRLYYDRKGNPVLLQKRVIITGDQITSASSGFDQQSGQPSVNVSLDGAGAKIMARTTQENLKKPMAVVFIDTKNETRQVDGKTVSVAIPEEKVINVATIQSVFSRRFQITGLDSPREAHDLALLLRAGSLAAPMRIVEERTIGPSLGAQNIEMGFKSVVAGFLLVLIFMGLYYKAFGMVANVALAVNLVLMIAILSMFQATLTLPGIAGIVLTVGMSVDANVLIFERGGSIYSEYAVDQAISMASARLPTPISPP